MVDGDPAIIISIHSLRMEGDTAYPDQTNQGYNFNPLPPHGGRLSYVSDIPSCVTISIHSLRMEGDTSSGYAFPGKYISIHSLRMEGDYHALLSKLHGTISIHSLRMEGDQTQREFRYQDFPFQSTPSAWRETAPLLLRRYS